MRKDRTRPSLPSVLRRILALFVALTTCGVVWLTADFKAAARALEGLADNADVAVALLDAELGAREAGGLAGLDRLALAGSPMLSANLGAVARWLEDHEDAQDPTESALPQTSASPSPEPSPEAAPSQGPAVTSAPEDIVGRTMVPGASSRYVSDGDLYIYNYTDYELDIPELLKNAPSPALSQAEGPQVLIYHTHATEAYAMDGTDIYEESDTSRTTDPNYNMIRIGEEMKAVFEEAGLEVIHDETLYDYPVYADAYSRSARGIEAILAEHPSIQLVLDVHRDALQGADGTVYKTVAGTVPDCAQIMLVVGSNAGGQAHDDWREDLSFAAGLQRKVLDDYGTLIRPIVLRSSRFNQQYRPCSLLVEVGSHGNTLQEAIAAARLFARETAELVK